MSEFFVNVVLDTIRNAYLTLSNVSVEGIDNCEYSDDFFSLLLAYVLDTMRELCRKEEEMLLNATLVLQKS